MHLKKIEIRGFKSFPSKTEIIFEQGITSIVGPNGSGKSNVSDAIRWVLGEQSIKSLRGDKLEDVIFAGSENKKPMSFCEVALTIDNKDGILDIDYSEVTIKRVAYKSGESQFYINNKSCRLKDIKELLLDTGIGKEGYSIIEQGKIDEILSGNVSSRRKVFEEAAGISKYRYKKEEGEKNLKITKENLSRICDIYDEIEKQLRPLEIQREKAIKYVDLKKELKSLEVNSYLKEIEAIDTQLKELCSHKEILQNQLMNLENKKDKEEKKVYTLEENLNKLDLKINEQNEQLYSLKIEIDHKKSDLELLNEKIKNIEFNQSKNEKEIVTLKETMLKNDEYITNLNKSKQEISERLGNLKKEKNDIDSTIQSYNEDLKNKQKEIERLKDEIITILDEKNKKNAKLSSLRTTLDNINEREKTIKREIEDINQNIKQKHFQLEQYLIKKNEYEERFKNLNKDRNEKHNKSITIKNNLDNIKESINTANLKINEYSSKLNIFYEMEKQYEGFNKGVKEVLKNKNLKNILGAVAEIINVPKEYETAIEVALGASLQNIITENEESAKHAIDYLKKNNLGRVTFLPLNIIKGRKINNNEISNVNGVLGVASDIIKCDNKFKNVVEHLLGRIILTKDIDTAISIAKCTNYKYKIVTLDGEVFNAGGSLTGGSIKSVNNLLSRKRMIEEFEKNIKIENENLNKFKNYKIQTELELERIYSDLNDLDIRIKEEDKLILTNQSSIYKVNEEIESLNSLKSKLEREEKGLIQNINYTNELINATLSEIEDTNKKSIAIEERVSFINDEKLQKEKLYEKDVAIYNEVNLDIAKLSENLKNIQKDIERMCEEKQSLENIIKSKEEEIANNKSFKQDLSEKLILVRVEKEELKEKLNDIELSLKECKLQRENILSQLKDNKENLKHTDEQFIDLKESIYKLESKLDKLELSQESYFTKLWNDYEITFYEALKIKDEFIVIDKKRIDNIKREIKNLGNVNVDSIKEYEDIKERYDLYKEQKEDLESSIESIEELIKDMEQNMKFEFSKNFEKINENFKVVFQKLFGGGHGELRLTDLSNILECDIEITAQPPGKKLKNINLLSGGEKALTAICILFSIILAKPTPFCILDEIEAPLDDANIYRYGEFLKELSSKTQFITITHRRGTMEASNYIYGVSMQEKGISKIISLKIQDAQKFIDEEVI
ncbi:chromosome segregation protein SMC [Alkalithermobacter paradoxus]|uniref:Chromosome partition protein Smc n=1 Tax=Alkalithermobacter paradoxus TaxID=29349 RepID=A0A1V4I6L4_9FIRM|nr:chromosome partition protein Smc [[Clostridium] thermoalcaliphilum]